MEINYYDATHREYINTLRMVFIIIAIILSTMCIIMLDITIGVVMFTVYCTTRIINHYNQEA